MITAYKDNPDLGLPTVTTVKGETEYRANCRRIKDVYYIKNKDVFFVNRTWYILDKGNIVYDHEKKEMVVKKGFNGVNGIVGMDNGKPVLGFFTRNPYNNVSVNYNDSSVLCISKEVLPDTYKLDPRNWLYTLTRNNFPIKNYHDHRRHTTYNIDDNTSQFENAKKLHREYNHPVTSRLQRVAALLGDMTFGAEIECIEGWLENRIMERHGVVVCRDGSLTAPDGTNGPEYVTVPLQGSKGIQTLKEVSDEISKSNNINYNCALHIHTGNIRTDRAYLVSLYKLGVFIQNDLFKMFPFYKNDEVKYAGKQKNYCKKLKNLIPDYEGSSKEEYDTYINNGYKIIFTWLLDGNAVPTININRTNRVHPQSNKWDRVSRYYWLNFMNMFFSKRNTMEFRLHTPTTNSKKINTWLFICKAILKYADLHSDKIIKGYKPTIQEIFSVFSGTPIGEHMVTHLNNYYNERCKFFAELKAKDDYVPLSEINSDKTYTFGFESPFKEIF